MKEKEETLRRGEKRRGQKSGEKRRREKGKVEKLFGLNEEVRRYVTTTATYYCRTQLNTKVQDKNMRSSIGELQRNILEAFVERNCQRDHEAIVFTISWLIAN